MTAMRNAEETTKLEVYDDATGELVEIDDPELEAELRAAMAEADRGEFVSMDDFLRELRSKG